MSQDQAGKPEAWDTFSQRFLKIFSIWQMGKTFAIQSMVPSPTTSPRPRAHPLHSHFPFQIFPTVHRTFLKTDLFSKNEKQQQQKEAIPSVEVRLCLRIFKFSSIVPKITSILVVLLPWLGKPGWRGWGGVSPGAPSQLHPLHACMHHPGHMCAALNPYTWG